MKKFTMNYDKSFLRKRLGSMSQLGGLKKYHLSNGRGDGVEAVDVRTGAGLSYTVLPGRGMDIAWTDYKGVPVSYMSNTGVSAGAYVEGGMEWLRNFFAGLLTTCGLSNVGGPCSDTHPVIGERTYGLHGRISNIPADQVCVHEGWEEDKYVMSVSGKMTESIVHGETLSLQRTVSSVLGENVIRIHDVIENEGNVETPLMVLYHMNLGYPVLSEHARLLIAPSSVKGASDLAEQEIDKYASFHPPVLGREERCYFHVVKENADGKTKVALINDELEIAVVFSYYPKQLPCFTEWKMLNEGVYVLGIEPGNSNPIGRVNAREKGVLHTLAPGEKKVVDLEIQIIESKEEIENLEREINALKERV